MNFPLVAIIGLPNSGKSTLFNKILENRQALIHPTAGTTRDRAYGCTSWNGFEFYLVDTAGIARASSDLEKNIQKQTDIALNEADLILLVSDGTTDPGNQELQIATRLTRSRKPTLSVVNKIDVQNAKTISSAEQYRKLGLGQPFSVSAVNGSGIGDLLDEIVKKLNSQFEIRNSKITDYGLRIAFIGKPNVGKSSLINTLLKQERLIVDKKAGTTRSSVEIPFAFHGTNFTLIDTAGIKRKWKKDFDVETAAANQALRMIQAVDVVLFVLDASASLTTQDQAIARKIVEEQKPTVVVLNKTDLIGTRTQETVLARLPDYFSSLWWAPVVFVSAKTGLNLDVCLKLAQIAYEKSRQIIPQETLDEFFDQAVKTNIPGKMDDQRAPKLYNLKQTGSNPPQFTLTVNFPAAIATPWKNKFEKQFRLKFDFQGTPVLINYRKRT